MYSEHTLISPSTWSTASNGSIFLRDISISGPASLLCDVTTPWGELDSMTGFDSGECRIYSQNPSGKSHRYIVKVVSINTTARTAVFHVLSYAYSESLLYGPGGNQLNVADNLPVLALPSSTVNYDFTITNNSSNSISAVRYILASNLGNLPQIVVDSNADCNKSLPPTNYRNKHCWYNDWISGTSGCMSQSMPAGSHIHVTGSFTMPSSGTEAFTLGIFVEVPNYWGSGKSEFVAPAGYHYGYSSSVIASLCGGVVCEEGCSGNDLYGQHCNPSTGLCEIDTTPKEVNSLKCTATHVLDIGISPFSWYTPSSALSSMTTKLIELNGSLFNWFTSITDYQYLGVDTFQDGNNVVIRIYLKNLSTVSSMDIMTLIAWTPLIILVCVITLAIGPIIWYKLTDWYYKNILSIRTYTAGAVLHIIFGGGEFGDGVVGKQLENCDTNFGTDAAGLKNCYKSVICGAADGSVDALGLPVLTDCTHQQVNQKIDACFTQFSIDHNLVKLKECMTKVKDDTGKKLQVEADKKSEGSAGVGLLILGIIGLAAFSMMGKGGGTITVKAEK